MERPHPPSSSTREAPRSTACGWRASACAAPVSAPRPAERQAVAGSDRFAVNYDLPSADYFAFWIDPQDANGLSYTSAPLTSAQAILGFPVVHVRLAADRLRSSGEGLATVARSLGYDSESAFGKAFRRTLGCSPRKYGREAAQAG